MIDGGKERVVRGFIYPPFDPPVRDSVRIYSPFDPPVKDSVRKRTYRIPYVAGSVVAAACCSSSFVTKLSVCMSCPIYSPQD